MYWTIGVVHETERTSNRGGGLFVNWLFRDFGGWWHVMLITTRLRKNNRRGRFLNTLTNSLNEVINVNFARKLTIVSLHDIINIITIAITGKLIIGKLSEFIGILTANCCTAIYDHFRGANSSFAAVSEVFWELLAPNLMILLLFR